jgi:hypothetical protein
MKRGNRYVGMVLLLSALALGGGCGEEFWAANAFSFAAGWLARGLAARPGDTQLTCYRNGVEIDCAEVPAELQPTPG